MRTSIIEELKNQLQKPYVPTKVKMVIQLLSYLEKGQGQVLDRNLLMEQIWALEQISTLTIMSICNRASLANVTFPTKRMNLCTQQISFATYTQSSIPSSSCACPSLDHDLFTCIRCNFLRNLRVTPLIWIKHVYVYNLVCKTPLFVQVIFVGQPWARVVLPSQPKEYKVPIVPWFLEQFQKAYENCIQYIKIIKQKASRK